MNYRTITFPENSLFVVTGGASFIGSNLCEAVLSMGHRVRVLDNLSTGYAKNIAGFRDNPKFEFVEGDIRDAPLCQCMRGRGLCAASGSGGECTGEH